MKNLEEKKLLVKMSQMLGQPVDQSLVESIKREEELNARLFKAQEVSQPLIEIAPLPPPPPSPPPPPQPKPLPATGPFTFVPNNLEAKLKDAEIGALRKTISEISNKINTLAWGGGGTGVVRIHDTDDFDKNSYGEGRYLKWSQGMFRLDTLTSSDVNNGTTLVEENEYYVLDDDWYIGVNYAGTVNIYLPTTATNGRNLVIKDESGNCANNPIIAIGTVDNDAGGFNLQINNGAIHMVYRNGWRII